MADDNAQTIPGQEFGPMGEHGVHMTLHDTTAKPPRWASWRSVLPRCC